MTEVGAKRIIAVGGGKGGVGKSIVAANLAVTLAQARVKVVVVDADLGMANLHTLLGVSNRTKTIHGFLAHEFQDLTEAMVPVVTDGLQLIPGTVGHPGDSNLAHAQKLRVIRHLLALETDCLIIDVGAGDTYNTLDFFNLADLRLLVLNDQLTSVQNAYAFLKASVQRAIRQAARTDSQRQLFEAIKKGSSQERLRNQLQNLANQDREYAQSVLIALNSFSLQLVGNQLRSPGQPDVLYAMARMVRDFLGLHASVLGALRPSQAIHHSVSRRVPFMAGKNNYDENATVFRRMAKALLACDMAALRDKRLANTLSDYSQAAAQAAEQTSAGGRPPMPHAVPTQVDHYKRRHARLVLNLPSTLTVEEGRPPMAATVEDISRSGAGITVATTLHIGQPVVLTIASTTDQQSGGEGAQVSLNAVVRRADSEKQSYGLQFTGDTVVPDIVLKHGKPA